MGRYVMDKKPTMKQLMEDREVAIQLHAGAVEACDPKGAEIAQEMREEVEEKIRDLLFRTPKSS